MLKSEIIGPLSPKEKAELREILIGMGEPVESIKDWMLNSGENNSVEFFLIEWITDNQTPTTTFEAFKTKYFNATK